MKLFISLSIILTLSLQASEEPYLLSIERNGTKHTMLANNFWSGEYPSPVISVQAKEEKWQKVMGYNSLRSLGKKKSCTIKTGIYHPWSRDKTSLINFYSIIPLVSYLVQKDTVLEETKLKKGDKLEREVYLSEGFCSYALKDGKEFQATCIDEKDENFKRIESASHPSEQWLYLSCKEKYNVFVQDSDLLRQPHVKEGQITGYGEVAEK
ncbi:MAG: Unknown protein [uncultured Sulfurovum sp.]|uniref:Uncharacterized protein n=1 Tax=uncultured Sulfurovum sp. TaxID=269237 RepID=A0A6S6S3R2_9BACT|nr:MAG: Unknown protein [uncultured Sulfurovum sp.]